MLQTVSGRKSDAPMGALDEWEIQQRNEARSIGLTITQGLVMASVFVLIFLATGYDNERLAYAGALWTLVGLLAGICSPPSFSPGSRLIPNPKTSINERAP